MPVIIWMPCLRCFPYYDEKEFCNFLITDENFKNNYEDIVNGIFLYTDEDVEIVKYIRVNFEAINELTGKWSRIYILEEPTPSLIALSKYWKSILLAKLYKEWELVRWITNTKPFDRNNSLRIAQQLSIPYDKFPCLVLLSPLKEISSQDKLIIPIQQVSKEYFRNLFSTLENIVNYSQEVNKYESIKIQFETIVKCLEEKSQKFSTKTETKYELNGINIFIDKLEETNMTEQNPIYIDKSNIASVTGPGKINTAIVEQHNYSPEQKQNLAEAAQEIQDLLNQLSKTYSPPNPKNNLKIATATLEKIEKNPTLKSRVINALKVGGTEAIKELLDHPAVNILMASIEGFTSAE